MAGTGTGTGTPRVKLHHNVWVQVLTLVGHTAAEVKGLIPEDYRVYAWAAQGIAQILLTVVAGKLNPDGTPAVVAYEPE